MIGAILSVTVTALDGTTATDACTEAVAPNDEDAPEIVTAYVEDAWTLNVEFDEDIFKGDDYALAVTLGSTELEVKETIDGSTMTITKADSSSFAAGKYTISVLDVEDEYGNASDELTAEVTKDNSYAVGFKAYEGYVAEYDAVGQWEEGNTQARYIHVSVTDQYGEEMDSALSSTYGTVTVKAHIKSNNSIIAARFNKSGAESTVDGKDMAYVTLTADKDFKAGETVVIDLVNKVDGVEYASEMEVEIIGYDLVQTAQVVTEMTVTTDKTANISKTWTDDGESGVMTLSNNNKVFLVVSALDSNGIAAKKGNIKFVSSDPTIVKVGSWDGAKFGETAITSKLYDSDGTIANGTIDDEDTFGLWLDGQKAGTATITAYATGFVDNAYTFDVTITEAALTISDATAYVGEKAYFPITKTDGIKHSTLTPAVTAMYMVDEDGDETQVATPVAGKYLGTASAEDKNLGLKDGVSYLTLTMNSATQENQANYKALVSVSSGTVAKSEETEVTLSPRITVDGDKKAGSGIYLGQENTAVTTAVTKLSAPTASVKTPQNQEIGNGVASDDEISAQRTAGYKGESFYKTINVINTTPIMIGNYAANQIKYAWSDDTTGSAKVDISSDYTYDTTGAVTTALQTAGVALITITPKTDELIGTLTLSIGGAEKELKVKLGKTVSGASLSAEVANGTKATLLDTTTAGPRYAIKGAATGKNDVILTVKDQYGDALAGLAFNGSNGTKALRLKNAPTTTAGPATIAGELTVTQDAVTDANGQCHMSFTNIYPGTHSLTFYVGEDENEVGEGDAQVTVDLTFVKYSDLTSIVPKSSVEWTADSASTGNGNWSDVVGKFGDAATTTAGTVAAGMFLDTDDDSEIKPSAAVYAGDVEVANVPVTWSILDNELSFTETWIENTTAHTPAGSQTVSAVDDGTAGWATTDGTKITIDVDGATTFGVPTANGAYTVATGARADASKAGVWTAGTDNLDDVLKFVKNADSGNAATLTATIHLNANVAGTALDAQSYVHMSTAGMSIDVDDTYLVYANRNDAIGVKKNEIVTDSVIVKAGDAAGTVLRTVAVDSTYGATLWSDAADVFVTDDATAGLIVGTDATAVNNGSSVANGVITVKANTGTAGKSASVRVTFKSGDKNRVYSIPLKVIN